MAGAKWMYDMFGSVGKAILKNQQQKCKKQGMKYDREAGRCIPVKDKEDDK